MNLELGLTLSIFTLFSVVTGEISDIELLQQYLAIDTTLPHPNYNAAIDWLEEQAQQLNLKFSSTNVTDAETNTTVPVAWLTWNGTDPSLSSILLYNHMDTVPIQPGWTMDPFGKDLINGKIYGRGSQDMKTVGVQQILAMKKLELENFKPVRNIHLGFFPDEEKGGISGLNLFMNTPEFAEMNVGFALDEGMLNSQGKDNGIADLFYTERKMLWVKFTINGTTGHGSTLPNNTASEKLLKLMNTMLGLRESEKWRLSADKSLELGDITTINLNMIEGGQQVNVIPSSITAMFDIRVTPHWNLPKFHNFLNSACENAGKDVKFQLLVNTSLEQHEFQTDLSQESWWWKALYDGLNKTNLQPHPRIFPAGTDGRFLRAKGIPVIGFSPIFKTPNLLHGIDEYLLEADFTRGIQVYYNLIQMLSSSSSDEIDNPNEPGMGTTFKPPIVTSNTKKPSNSSAISVKPIFYSSAQWITILAMVSTTTFLHSF